MATGTTSNAPCSHLIGYTAVDLSRNTRTFAPVRISCKNSNNNGLSVRNNDNYKDRQPSSPALVEGPSCLFVGPIESASQETLEALYRQVRLLININSLVLIEFLFLVGDCCELIC